MADILEKEFKALNIKDADLSIVDINRRIKLEKCDEACQALSDSSLFEEYKKATSVKHRINNLTKILSNHDISADSIDKIITDYMHELIPPALKGQVRGIKFNTIVAMRIMAISLGDEFDIQIEKNCPIVKTDEIPDWYILNKKSKRVIIGMNQLDLWGGGQQYNRGCKYIFNTKWNSSDIKLVSVVCNLVVIKSSKNKTYRLFNEGFRRDNLCYLNNLENIIKKFFSIPQEE